MIRTVWWGGKALLEGSSVSECPLLLQVLLPAASLLQLMDVRQNCCDFLQSQLHPTNCLGIRAFADVHTCTDLLQQANAYAGNGDWAATPPPTLWIE